MDRISKTARSRVMASVHASGTKLESQFTDWLRGLGLSTFERNAADVFGKPDIAFVNERIAIFIDSCFWHGCRWHCRMPASHKSYWQHKISRNKARDRYVRKVLRRQGWKVIRIWEHGLANEKLCGNALARVREQLPNQISTAKKSQSKTAGRRTRIRSRK